MKATSTPQTPHDRPCGVLVVHPLTDRLVLVIQIPRKGDRIRLVEMPDDPDPIEPGATGVVFGVLRDGCSLQIDVDWDNGRTLMLVSPPDRVEIVRQRG